MPLPIDQIPVGVGINPQTPEGSCLFYVSRSALNKVEDNGPESKWHDAKLLSEAIKNPAVIFSGLKRKGVSEGYCFSCLPTHRHLNDGTLVPRTAGRVFCLYVEMRQYGPVVFDWDWRPGNDNTGHPYEARDNFGSEVWRKT